MSIVSTGASRPDRWTAARVSVVWRAFDLQLSVYAGTLLVFGLAMAYSNTVTSGVGILDGASVFLRALMWTAIALAVFVVATAFDYHWLKTFAWPLYLIQIGLLVITLAIGSGVGGSSRWVSIFGLQFQFSELAKVLMIVVLANYLGEREIGRLGSLWALLGAGILAGPPFVLVLLQPDLGTSLVFGAILVGDPVHVGREPKWLGVLGGERGGCLPVRLDVRPRRLPEGPADLLPRPAGGPRRGRATSWPNPRSRLAPAAWFGIGLTNGSQTQLGFLPVQSTDFVFAILGEELGFVGAVVVLALFVALLWRVLVGGWRSKDPFGMIFASGVARDAPVPAGRERRDGPRDHADHGHPAALRQPWRRVADQHRHRLGFLQSINIRQSTRGVVSARPTR